MWAMYPPHWEGFGQIPPQGGPKDDREVTSAREVRHVGIPPAGARDGGGVNAGGGDLHLPPIEQGCTFYCYQDHYGPVSGGREETRSKGVQEVVRTGLGGYGGDVDGGLVRGSDEGGGGGDRWDLDRYRLSWWEDNVANFNLGTDHNSPLVYAPRLEHQNPIMSKVGDPRGHL